MIILLIGVVNYYKGFNNTYKKNYLVEYNNPSDELEDKVLMILACEMPASYNEEALKAQAISTRTFLYYQLYNGENPFTSTAQCSITEDEMKNKWNNDFDKYYNKLKNIVNDTKGIVMNKDDELFKSFYFSTTNGYTEESSTVFKVNTLSSVDSSWDKKSKDYLKEIKYTKKELENMLGKFNEIKITKRNKTNHVEKVKVDDKVYEGTKFRKLLNLRSTDFDISINNDEYTFTTRGYGHGVGMSQYGANYLANQGYSYEYILNYYYQNITFKTYV